MPAATSRVPPYHRLVDVRAFEVLEELREAPTADLGAPVPLTGRYATQGAQVRRALELWARDVRARLVLLDDRSDPARAAAAHNELTRRCRIVLGPYGSDSTRAVTGAVWNHGAAADDVQERPGVVSIPSPASRYLVALARGVAALHPGARVAVTTARGRFPALAREGLERSAAVLGIELVRPSERPDAMLVCGPLEWELATFRRIGPGPILGGVSPALSAFPELLAGDADGFLGSAQWHPELRPRVELGPERVELADFVGAQAYAAALVAAHCLELEPDDPVGAGRRLATTTFFGGFRLDPASGVQRGHRLAVVRWRRGRQQVLLEDAA